MRFYLHYQPILFDFFVFHRFFVRYCFSIFPRGKGRLKAVLLKHIISPRTPAGVLLPSSAAVPRTAPDRTRFSWYSHLCPGRHTFRKSNNRGWIPYARISQSLSPGTFHNTLFQYPHNTSPSFQSFVASFLRFSPPWKKLPFGHQITTSGHFVQKRFIHRHKILNISIIDFLPDGSYCPILYQGTVAHHSHSLYRCDTHFYLYRKLKKFQKFYYSARK